MADLLKGLAWTLDAKGLASTCGEQLASMLGFFSANILWDASQARRAVGCKLFLLSSCLTCQQFSWETYIPVSRSAAKWAFGVFLRVKLDADPFFCDCLLWDSAYELLGHRNSAYHPQMRKLTFEFSM
jgi:hypothetical protein